MTTISYTVTSSTGEEHFADIPIATALTDIKNQINKNSKWLFIDRNQETVETVTEAKLAGGDVIMLTDMLGGG
jgi:hypothetical protein